MAVDEKSNRGFIIVVVAILALAVFASNLQGSSTGYAAYSPMNAYRACAEAANEQYKMAARSNDMNVRAGAVDRYKLELDGCVETHFAQRNPTRVREIVPGPRGYGSTTPKLPSR